MLFKKKTEQMRVMVTKKHKNYDGGINYTHTGAVFV